MSLLVSVGMCHAVVIFLLSTESTATLDRQDVVLLSDPKDTFLDFQFIIESHFEIGCL